ncbi:DUF5007 domain-containing protein [Pedobacter frigoris]|uniref:DUF5007 domain-containing protein n=1 Tax=Pedobacter frigoris TaxID=2571272 RepID=A0A4U1CGX6_9SPHI|nr:DUF5007 domain-containing protein [Pedobacter frigoris]TKC03671.1 DUF5007 domain-containing protein [Pedobacter frigoris]
MKKLIIKALALVLTVSAIAIACKKVPDGFLSPNIRYEETPILVPQGIVKVSTALTLDGSAMPIKVKLLHVYDRATGKNVDDIFAKKYSIKVWTGLYDPKVDNTLEKIDAKRKDSLVYPISINEFSGQLEANFATLNIPLGQYDFDLEVSNSAGSKVYPKIGKFNLNPAAPFEIPAAGSQVAMKVGAETTTKVLSPTITTVKKLSDSPDKIIVRLTDKNGVPFNAAAGEIGRRPVGGTSTGFLQTMDLYSLSVTNFADRMEFIYGTVPFPLTSLGNGFNYYYRIPTQFVHFDDPALPDGQYSCNARFSFRVFVPGTYEVTVKIPGVTRR